MGAAAAGRPVRAGDLGAGQPRAVDPRADPKVHLAGRAGTAPGRVCRKPRRRHPRGPYPAGRGPGGPVAVGRCSCSTTTRSGAPAAHARRRRCASRRHRHRLHRRVPAAPRPVPSREAWCPPGSPRTGGAAWPRNMPRCWSTTGRWSARAHQGSCATRSSRQWCGTELTADWHRRFNGRRRSSTATCTSRAPPGPTGCASRRSRSATPASGTRRGPAPPGPRVIL